MSHKDDSNDVMTTHHPRVFFKPSKYLSSMPRRSSNEMLFAENMADNYGDEWDVYFTVVQNRDDIVFMKERSDSNILEMFFPHYPNV